MLNIPHHLGYNNSLRNVLYIASYENVRFKGGIYTIAAKVIAHTKDFADQGVKLSFLSSCQIPRKLSKVGRLSMQNIQNALLVRAKIKEQLITSSIDTVYINTSNSIAFLKDVWLCRIVKKRSKAKTILHIHYSDIEQILPSNSVLKAICKVWLHRYVDHIITLNSYTKEQFESNFKNLKISVIPNFSTIELGYTKREDHSVLRLLYLGTIDLRKGFNKCVLIARQLLEQKVNFKLTVAGTWLDADFKREMTGRIDELGLGEAIHFAGFVDEEAREKLLKQSDCLLLLSQNEGMSMALLEAMSSGLAVIASDIPAHQDVFGNTAIHLVIMEDIEGITHKLVAYAKDISVLIQDQQTCYKLSHQYTFDKFVNRTVTAIQSV